MLQFHFTSDVRHPGHGMVINPKTSNATLSCFSLKGSLKGPSSPFEEQRQRKIKNHGTAVSHKQEQRGLYMVVCFFLINLFWVWWLPNVYKIQKESADKFMLVAHIHRVLIAFRIEIVLLIWLGWRKNPRLMNNSGFCQLLQSLMESTVIPQKMPSQ